MKNTKLSKRYAKAFLDIALEKDILEKGKEDMIAILRVFNSSREFRLLMNSPVVSADKKYSILHELFNNRLHVATLLFLKILTLKHRELNIATIAYEFIELYKIHNNIRTVYLRTVAPLDEASRKKIVDMIKARFSCEVELIEQTDPELIGGYVLQVDDYHFDTSILEELNKLRKQFRDNVYKKVY